MILLIGYLIASDLQATLNALRRLYIFMVIHLCVYKATIKSEDSVKFGERTRSIEGRKGREMVCVF